MGGNHLVAVVGVLRREASNRHLPSGKSFLVHPKRPPLDPPLIWYGTVVRFTGTVGTVGTVGKRTKRTLSSVPTVPYHMYQPYRTKKTKPTSRTYQTCLDLT